MKKTFCLLLAMAMCLCLFAGCGSTTQAPAATEAPAAEESAEEAPVAEDPVTTIEGKLMPGDKVPNFTVTLTDGTVFTLSDALSTHKAVMVNLWGTWCHNCVDEMPFMQEAYENYSDDIAIVCLSKFDENDDIIGFMQKNNLNLPMGYDTLGLTDAVVQSGYPTTIMIDRFGVYAYYECGAINDSSKFTRMWDFFTSDDYTETKVVDDIPGAQFTGEYPTDEALSAALCPDGSLTFTYDHEDANLWPFVVTDNGVVNSNALQSDTTASLTTMFSAKAGDVFTVDYAADLTTCWQIFNFMVDGVSVNPVFYTYSSTWTYEFTEDSDAEITFEYEESCSADNAKAAGTVVLSNARLVSGDEAAEVLASKPAYTYSLDGTDFNLQVLNEDAKQIELNIPEGHDELVADFENAEMYIVPSSTAQLRMILGNGYDATQACGLSVSSAIAYIPCVLAENDGVGYTFETELSSMETDGESYTVVAMYPDAFGTTEDMAVKVVYLFTSEENVNAFIPENLKDNEGNPVEGVTWNYEDGTQPSTTEIAHEQSLYNITFVDENGEPVNDVTIQICDEKNCVLQTLEGTNYYGFNGLDNVAYPYEIHVFMVPDGYTKPEESIILNEAGDTVTITLPHA